MSAYLRLVLLILFVGSALLSAGCGDECGEGCPVGLVCQEDTCVVPAGNCGVCPTGQSCISDSCQVTGLQCAQVGESCDPRYVVNDDFFCIDVDGAGTSPPQCVVTCGEDGACDAGALCFFLESGADLSCTQESDCEDGKVCQQGACRDTICRPSECDGFLVGDAKCLEDYGGTQGFENGAICADFPNEASYCFPAGPRQLGESCVSTLVALDAGSFSQVCASGLGCVDDTCQAACLSGDDCGGEQECLLAESNLLGKGVGFCADACVPFASGGCGVQKACFPVTADQGVCIDALGERSPFDACDPGARQCPDGTLCITMQPEDAGLAINETARCMPICNVGAGELNPDGSVGDLAQAQRDATCPNPPVLPGYLSLQNLTSVTSLDIYLAEETAPIAANLAPGELFDADSSVSGVQLIERDTGAVTVRILPAGAPRTDPSLTEITLSMRSGVTNTIYVSAIPNVSDKLLSRASALSPTSGADLQVEWVHAAADVPSMDLVLVPPGDDLSNPANQVELVGSAVAGTEGWASIAAGRWDVLVFETGTARDNRINALALLDDVDLGTQPRISLAGTADLGDLSPLSLYVVQYPKPGPSVELGANFTCIDLDNGVFGYCQQNCGERAEGYAAGVCNGPNMGCGPVFANGIDEVKNLCGPVGSRGVGERCNPFATYGECQMGSYCEEFGNTSSGHDPLLRGICAPLCLEDEADHPVLKCGGQQTCRPVSYAPGFVVGECATPCDPDLNYSDSTCPLGTGSCLPVSSLQEDAASGGMNPPVAREEQPFCSVAGNVGLGEACTSQDCVPGSECMYPRTRQLGFSTSILSPYVGAAGVTPTCTAQCDPFDADSAAFQCQSGDTCLFNYPVSAEVGHCAPITVATRPGESCTNPGEACGQDSICVANGAENVCFQFCQYSGPSVGGELQPESCAAGFVCAPLSNDVGICLEP